MAVDVTKVTEIDVEPGELPETMAAWVIREEREGEPKDAFQLEEIEVPEPGAFEVIVRVMAAGVNYNNVWAALGEPVGVWRYGDHPEYGHHIGGSDASGVVWKVGEGVTRWKPGDEVVIHCNIASYEDPEVHGLDPLAAPSQKIWGYETTWGSFAQFTKVQAQQLLPKPKALSWDEAASYGLVYFTAYRMLITRCNIQAGDRVLIWGAAGGLGVFATQLCALAGAHAVGVVSSPDKGELVKQLGAVDYIDRNEFAGMMRKGGESVEAVSARADRVIARLQGVEGNVLVFSHGHFLRVLAARWLGLPPQDGALFVLWTATVSVLGFERETAVITRWNAPVASPSDASPTRSPASPSGEPRSAPRTG